MSHPAPFDAEIATLLDLAKSHSLPDVEVYARRDEALTLRAHQGGLESFQRSNSVGVGVRVLQGERVGYAYTENLTKPALERALLQAAGNAELVEAQAGSGLATANQTQPMTAIYNPGLDNVALDDKIARVLHLEAITRQADPRVKAVPGCSYSDQASVTRVASTKGLDAHYRANVAYALVYPIVSDGTENKTNFELILSRDFADLDVDGLSQRVVAGALRRLGAQNIASGTYPVVFAPRAMAELLNAFSDMFSAKAALEGKSLLAGKVSQNVGSAQVNIVDDALYTEGLSARPFDDEGTPSQRVSLIAGGVFKTFLHNIQTASQMGTTSTGHATRGGYKGVLGVGPTNLLLQPGGADQATLFAGDGPVVLIDDLQGLHAGTNAISGDFSLQAQGYLYEEGQEAHPVHNFTVAGNFLELLAGVTAVGDDVKYFPQAAFIGTPSVRVKGLAIAGA